MRRADAKAGKDSKAEFLGLIDQSKNCRIFTAFFIMKNLGCKNIFVDYNLLESFTTALYTEHERRMSAVLYILPNGNRIRRDAASRSNQSSLFFKRRGENHNSRIKEAA